MLQDQNKGDLLLDFVESEIFTKVLKERKPEYLNESLDAIDGLCAALEEFDTKIHDGEFGPLAAFWQLH